LRALIICRKKDNAAFNTIVSAQVVSLQRQGVVCTLWGINKGGLLGYFKAIIQLKRFIRTNQFDIFHAHYSLSGFVASLAKAQPLVVSLMGSDIQHNIVLRIVTKIFSSLFWKSTIVKSQQMKRAFNVAGTHVVPNGVNLSVFYNMDKEKCQQKLGWDLTKKHLLFAANPLRKEKNFELSKQAFMTIKHQNLELHYLSDVLPVDMPVWFNASDVILLSSLWEGSPNVIKEAMACSRPIVSTNVGDVKWLFGDEPGHYICSFDAEDVTRNIRLAIDFAMKHGRTQGLQRLIELGLDAETTAKRIIALYQKVVDKK
jgi:teichuronic acid biosynthesis glycosyltransferase TuaC